MKAAHRTAGLRLRFSNNLLLFENLTELLRNSVLAFQSASMPIHSFGWIRTLFSIAENFLAVLFAERVDGFLQV